jgi:nucleotide-binding universal stress UspA family protein
MSTPNKPVLADEPRLSTGRILVCLDRSAYSELSVDAAISLARTFARSVTLVHVMQPRAQHASPLTSDALDWEIARQEARGSLERIGSVIATALGQPVSVRIEQGHPALRIVELAREIRADLIVLGSHGEGASPRWNLGSTAQQVLASMSTSVFVAHGKTEGTESETRTCILVPLDGSLRAESVLPVAATLAHADGGEIVLVHVVHEPVVSALLHAPEDLALAQTLASHLQLNARRYLSRLERALVRDPSGIAVRTIVTQHVNERQCLLEITRREKASLVVLSAHGTGCDAARPFGNVAMHLLTHSNVSLLVLQDVPNTVPRERIHLDTHVQPQPLRASYASGPV